MNWEKFISKTIMHQELDHDASSLVMVRQILTFDLLYRKRRSWPLKSLNLKSYEFQSIRGASIPIFSSPNHKYSPTRSLNTDEMIFGLYTYYPDLTEIFEKYKGKVAVCGGLLARLACSKGRINTQHTDCDIFFYGAEEDKGEECLMQEYTAILEDCIGIIAENAVKELDLTVYVEKCDHVVNVRVMKDGDYIHRDYQFILRIYPTLDSILGGFDIGPAMLAYDGNDIVGTPLGIWSISKGCIIVDTTRRSTSFETRLMKYHKDLGFRLIFPGLDMVKIPSEKYIDEEEYVKMYKLLKEKGYRLANKNTSPIKKIPEEVILGGKIYVRRNEGEFELGIKYKTTTDEEKNSEETLKKLSDYGRYKTCFEDGSDQEFLFATILLNNRSGLFSTQELPKNHDEAINIFRNLVNKDLIITEDNFLTYERKLVRPHIWPTLDGERPCLSTQHHSRIFGKFLGEFHKLIKDYPWPEGSLEGDSARHEFRHSSKYIQFREKVYEENCKIVKERSEIWSQDFKGIKWRIKNPGGQDSMWTSSFNPIMKDPRDFYVNCYKSFRIGLPEEIETLFRCIWRYDVWKCLPKDLFDLLLKDIVYAYFDM